LGGRRVAINEPVLIVEEVGYRSRKEAIAALAAWKEAEYGSMDFATREAKQYIAFLEGWWKDMPAQYPATKAAKK
jgi:hypothetical protein